MLDAIRGVALGGILLANLMSFFGADMLEAEARRAMPGGRLGESVLFAINWLVEGKFYSIFSMLLGTGLALQAARAARRGTSPESFDGFFRRRMAVLVAIGLAHMYGLWCGDILTLYGIMGLLLPTMARLRPTARAAAMIVLFCVPFATHALVLVSDGRYDPRPPFAAVGTEVRERLGVAGRPALDLFAHGTAGDYWAWNTSFAVARPGSYLQSGRPAKVGHGEAQRAGGLAEETSLAAQGVAGIDSESAADRGPAGQESGCGQGHRHGDHHSQRAAGAAPE